MADRARFLGILGILLVLLVIVLLELPSCPGLDTPLVQHRPDEILHPGTPGNPDPALASLLLQVSESELHRTVSDLQDIPTRAYGTPGNREAAGYLLRRVSGYPNLSVEQQGGRLGNILATLPGRSGRTILVGAHYDSTSADPAHAPGATDNACGTAIVLELARVMSGYRWNNTLAFAFWNAEEEGLAGSSSFAREARERNLDIGFYLNYDSSCYDPENRFKIDLMYDYESAPVAEEMVRSNTLYGLGATLTHNLFDCEADQTSFQEAGYPAIMTHSESHGFRHTPGDTLDKVSFAYAAVNARLGMAAMARSAGLIEAG